MALLRRAKEDEQNRLAAVPPVSALRTIDNKIEGLQRKEARVAGNAARLREELQQAEAELASIRVELSAANTERNAAAARVAIPGITPEKPDIEAVVQSSLHALGRVSEIAGAGAYSAELRQHLERASELVSLAAAEASALAAARAAASAPVPADTALDTADTPFHARYPARHEPAARDSLHPARLRRSLGLALSHAGRRSPRRGRGHAFRPRHAPG